MSQKLVIKATADQQPLVMAWISLYDIEAIVEHEDSLDLFAAANLYADIKATLIEKLSLPEESFEVVTLEKKNWNAQWEANFQPLIIGDLYVRATFHEPQPAYSQELIISPKMAFGTGHHATTYMMLSYMDSLQLKDKSILDYGCGTGILAVYARMKGCGRLDAIDIQEEAIDNSYEHFELNKQSTTGVTIEQGDLDSLPSATYDVILANINRKVLLDQADNLKERLATNGLLIMSGILAEDRTLILHKYLSAGFTILDEDQRGEWCRFSFS